jgi:anhydro-N-acetylmuramic acid kinase
LTAESIADACERFLPVVPARYLVSGGGARNPAIVDRLARRVAPAVVAGTDSVGLDGDAKEAVAFAVLAHETLAGVPTGIPRVTGASRAAILGKICLPG